MSFLGMFGGDIVKGASDAFGKVLDKFVGDKISESELEKVKLEGSIELNKSLRDSEISFNERIKAEMSTKINIVVDTIRGLVRPIITFAITGFYGWVKYILVSALHRAFESAMQVPSIQADADKQVQLAVEFAKNAFTVYDFMLLTTVLTFWFGGKLLERYVEKMTKMMEASPAAVKNPGWMFKVANKLFK